MKSFFLIENIDCLVFKKVTFYLIMIIYFQLQYSKKTKWFNVQTKKWSRGPDMNKARSGHGCVKIPQTNLRKSKILVVGGLNVPEQNNPDNHLLFKFLCLSDIDECDPDLCPYDEICEDRINSFHCQKGKCSKTLSLAFI